MVGIFDSPIKWRRAFPILLVLTMMAALMGEVAAEETEAFDPGKVTGSEIQGYRDQYVPREYPAPARAWFYADVAVVTGLLLSGMWLVRTNRPVRWISAQLALALLYLGVIRGGCICPVGATANVALGVSHPELVGRATLALFLVPLMAALASGRIFCATVCPLGAVQQLLSGNRPRLVPRPLHRILLALPVVVLLATAGAIWTGIGFLPCLLDPYKPLFFQGHAFMQKLTALLSLGYAEPVRILAGSGLAWAILVAALVVGWFIPRVFCRYVCPYGVLLGLLSAVGFWRREIDVEACINCGRCVKHCPVQAIQHSPDGKTLKLSSYQCVQCGSCSTICKRQSILRQNPKTPLPTSAPGGP